MKRKERSSSTTAASDRRHKKTKTITDLEDAQDLSKLNFASPEELLSSLLAPTSTETFFSEYWEKEPLLIKREDSTFYGPLFSKSDLKSILNKEELEYVNDVNLCSYDEGDKMYLNGEVGSKVTWPEVAKKVKENNATIQFHQPQRFKEILWKLNGHLEMLFGCLVGANIYITPSKSQGLAPHYDDVEVFVLQLEGKKKWKLYKSPKELPQDYSPDLEQDSIGEPTHEFELQPGDMVYFPRGTVHQAIAHGDDSSTHITLSTYQQQSWGNLLSNMITDALDKAMDTDVSFRRGLPVDYFGFMGLAKQTDEKFKVKQEDFSNQVKHLLASLTKYVDAHASVDKVASDFMANRLPPIQQKEEAFRKDSEKAPTEDSKVKLLYSEHVRISVCERSDLAVGVVLDDMDSESDEEDEDSEEPMEDDDDEEPEAKKSNKAKKETKSKQEKKLKNGKKRNNAEEDSQESSGEPVEKATKTNKKDKKGKKNAKAKNAKANKANSEEEEQESSEENSKKDNDDSESDDDDASYELGEDDSDESDEDDDDDSDEEDEGPWVVVNHSLNNNRVGHMMGPQEPSIIKFPVSYKDALLQLYRDGTKNHIAVKSLPLDIEDAMHLVMSLWSEGLLDVKQ